MATTSATISSATFTKTVGVSVGRNSSQRKRSVVQVTGLSPYAGLKAYNGVAALGVPVSSGQAFAKLMSSLKKTSGRGGALSVSCNAGAEILQIILVINGLTLVGVAVGFLLLRFEAYVEESAE